MVKISGSSGHLFCCLPSRVQWNLKIMVTDQSELNTEVTVLLKLSAYNFLTMGSYLEQIKGDLNGEAVVPVR